jgi:hypothetical protein
MNTITWGNPYTHEEHKRTSYNKNDLLHGYGVCNWCGNVKTTLYTYDVMPAPNLMGQKVALFCGKECYKAYTY